MSWPDIPVAVHLVEREYLLHDHQIIQEATGFS